MSGLNQRERRQAAEICDEQQRKLYENAGVEYPGRICEVARARSFGDIEYLKEKWTEGECSPKIILDHIDNNDENNPIDGSNWQWLCRCHNLKKNPPHDRSRKHKFRDINKSEHFLRRRRERGGDGGKENNFWHGGDVYVVRSMEMAKNMMCQPIFETTIKKIMRREGEVKWNELVDAGVREARALLHDGNTLSITIKTGDEWLRPLTARLSSTAPFYVDKIGGEKIVKWKKEPKRKAKADKRLIDDEMPKMIKGKDGV